MCSSKPVAMALAIHLLNSPEAFYSPLKDQCLGVEQSKWHIDKTSEVSFQHYLYLCISYVSYKLCILMYYNILWLHTEMVKIL